MIKEIDTVTSDTYTEYVTEREVTKALKRHGAELVRQKGSHAQYRFYEHRVTVPTHKGDIPVGTLKQIERAMEPAFGKGWLK